MEPLEIICESCESRMRLSATLLEKIMGSSGRVTCRECKNKIFLNAIHGDVRVTKGGRFKKEPEVRNIEDVTKAKEFEAPVPDFSSAGSLSPQTLYDDEDDGLVPLGREFNSSPFSSERDQSYNSLFPQPERRPSPQVLDAPLKIAPRAPSPPGRGELRRRKSEPDLFKGELPITSAAEEAIVELGPGGQLINQADKKGRSSALPARSNQWVPWTVAAIALLGLGVSVSLDRRAPVVTKAQDPAPLSLGQPIAPAALVPEEVPLEEAPSAVELKEPQSAPAPVSEESVPAGTASRESSPSPAKAQDEATKGALSPEAAPQVSPGTSADMRTESENSGSDDERIGDGSSAVDEVEPPLLAPFSAPAAASAMRQATALAGACRKLGDPTGNAKVVVTFAPSGRVTSALVTGAPFAGTETGGCIASRFRTARVPAFAGEHVTVQKTVTIQ